MKGKDDSMCRKKVVKKFLIVGLLLSIILVIKMLYMQKNSKKIGKMIGSTAFA